MSKSTIEWNNEDLNINSKVNVNGLNEDLTTEIENLSKICLISVNESSTSNSTTITSNSNQDEKMDLVGSITPDNDVYGFIIEFESSFYNRAELRYGNLDNGILTFKNNSTSEELFTHNVGYEVIDGGNSRFLTKCYLFNVKDAIDVYFQPRFRDHATERTNVNFPISANFTLKQTKIFKK